MTSRKTKLERKARAKARRTGRMEPFVAADGTYDYFAAIKGAVARMDREGRQPRQMTIDEPPGGYPYALEFPR